MATEGSNIEVELLGLEHALKSAGLSQLAQAFGRTSAAIGWLVRQKDFHQSSTSAWSVPRGALVRGGTSHGAHSDGDIGTLLRLLCILESLFIASQSRTEQPQWTSHPTDSRRQAKKSTDEAIWSSASDLCDFRERYRLSTYLKTAIVYNEAPCAWDDEPSDEALLAAPWVALSAFIAKARSGLDLPHLSLKAILQHRICMPGESVGLVALGRFVDWVFLGRDSRTRDELATLRCEALLLSSSAGDLREAQVSSLVDSLLSRQGGSVAQVSDTEPIVNVWSPSNWTGLRAFATEVLLRLRESVHGVASGPKPLPFIYVPVSRAAGEIGSLSSKRTRATVYTRESAIKLLRSACGLSAREEEPSERALGQDLLELQQHFAANPCVIVVDGLAQSPPPLGPVFDVIKNTDWGLFIRSLVQPGVGSRQADGRFQSRILVLSGRPMRALRPWMAVDSIELSQLPSPLYAYGFLARSESDASTPELGRAVREIAELRSSLTDRVLRAWSSSDRFAPDSGVHKQDLANLYALAPSTVRRFVEAGVVPNEIELTIAWCLEACGDVELATAASISDPQVRLKSLRRFFNEVPTSGELLALRFIAMSINGLRGATLVRCLKRYAEIEADIENRRSIESTLKELTSDSTRRALCLKYRPLIVLTTDEDGTSVRKSWRWFELHANAGSVEIDKKRESEVWLIDLRLEALREYIFADLVGNDGRFNRSERANEQFLNIQRILCDEALLQGTAQLRETSTHPADASSVHALTLFVQAIFHGLLSISFAGSQNRVSRSELQSDVQSHARALPNGDYKRFIYLYSMIYRQCVENAPIWLLTRAFGRDDARVALACMFINPDWARNVLGALYCVPWDHRTYSNFGAFDEIGVRDFVGAFDLNAGHLQGEMGADLFAALLHSIRRSNVRHLSLRAMSVGGALFNRASAGRRRSPLGGPAFDFTKLRIDLLQTSEQPGEVRRDCVRVLTGLRTGIELNLEALGEKFVDCKLNRARFNEEILGGLVKGALAKLASQEALEQVSDLLYRYGEATATEADWSSDVDESDARLSVYVSAYASFWIADRIRSGAAIAERGSTRWPSVSARAMRYYVRVSLKLSKLLGRKAFDARDDDDARRYFSAEALGFYDFARSRIDVYTRHMFRVPSECVHILLLMSSAARVRGRLVGLVGDPPVAERHYGEQSLTYIRHAEHLYLQLGLGVGILRRLLLERIKSSRHPVFGGPAVVASDLAVLKRLSAQSPYWTLLVSRLEAR
jgi:hypothetical protein